jgi:hypothetical protein
MISLDWIECLALSSSRVISSGDRRVPRVNHIITGDARSPQGVIHDIEAANIPKLDRVMRRDLRGYSWQLLVQQATSQFVEIEVMSKNADEAW